MRKFLKDFCDSLNVDKAAETNSAVFIATIIGVLSLIFTVLLLFLAGAAGLNMLGIRLLLTCLIFTFIPYLIQHYLKDS